MKMDLNKVLLSFPQLSNLSHLNKWLLLDTNLLLQHESDLGTVRMQSQLLYIYKWHSTQCIGFKSWLSSWHNALCYEFSIEKSTSAQLTVACENNWDHFLLHYAQGCTKQNNSDNATVSHQMLEPKNRECGINNTGSYCFWPLSLLCDSDVTIKPTIRSCDRANLRDTHCSITHIGCCLSAEFTDYIWCCNQLCDILHQSKIQFLLQIIKPKFYLYVISYINISNGSLCSWKVGFINSLHNPLFRINQNTRKICKKFISHTPGVASWTVKAEWIRVKHWMKDCADTPEIMIKNDWAQFTCKANNKET